MQIRFREEMSMAKAKPKRLPAIQAHFSHCQFEAIDNWRRSQRHIPPLAEAMRTLVQMGLDAAQSEEEEAV
jgi:hypothetical protein